MGNDPSATARTLRPVDHDGDGYLGRQWEPGCWHTMPADLGARLRARRRRLGLSFRVAGRRIGIDGSYLYRLELGERAPSTTVAELVIRGLGLDAVTAAELRRHAVPGVGRDRKAS